MSSLKPTPPPRPSTARPSTSHPSISALTRVGRHHKDRWERKSMDLSSTEPLLSPTSLRAFSQQTSSNPNLRRSRSLWSKGSSRTHGCGEPEEPGSDRASVIKDLKEGGPFGDHGQLTDKQRALIIKRARKMAQVFGTEPPPSLYQIPTGTADAPPTPNPQRESIATLLSLPSNEPLLSPTPHLTKRLSSSSISSVSSEPSMRTSIIDTPSLRSRKSESDYARQDARPPPTPPPFSQIFRVEPAQPAASLRRAPTDAENNATFRQRRMRAAKLSRFFGVAYHDLSESLNADPPPPPLHSAFSRVEDAMEPPTVTKLPAVEVDVKFEPGRFWALMDGRHHNVREPDMNDVIGKLRQMR
ncbi:hypothetical protein EW146_g1083 [Bondarzewia mesenterica]|uniref:Uncharacterized protein n=1 Tax=Bondarzewia mesenterica TaxID=1095465 RepID=A0A4S4M6R7_9AGAM|nr:hypothetical protein EW146_g1083 [Bondarzewia mesenterica]